VAGSIRSELSASFANAALAPHERAAAARVAAEQDELAALAADGNSAIMGSRSVSGEALNPRAAAAAAAEARRLAAEAAAAETTRKVPVAKDDGPSEETVEVVEKAVAEQEEAVSNDNAMALDELQASNTVDDGTTRTTGTTNEGLSPSAPAPLIPIADADDPSSLPPAPAPPVPAADEALSSLSSPSSSLASSLASPEASSSQASSPSSSRQASAFTSDAPKNPWASPEESSSSSSSTTTTSSSIDDPISDVITEPNSREARLRRAVSALKSIACTPVSTTPSASSSLQASTPPSPAAAMKEAEAMVALQEVASRVLAEPHESKYRKLRRGNKRFARSIGASPPAMEWLRAVGFTDDDESDFLILPPGADLGLLWLGRELLTGP